MGGRVPADPYPRLSCVWERDVCLRLVWVRKACRTYAHCVRYGLPSKNRAAMRNTHECVKRSMGSCVRCSAALILRAAC